MAEYVKALQMDKTLVNNYYYLGTVYEALKQPLKAIEEYQKFVRLSSCRQCQYGCRRASSRYWRQVVNKQSELSLL